MEKLKNRNKSEKNENENENDIETAGKPEVVQRKHATFGAKLKHFASTTKGKVVFIVLGILIVIGILMAVPNTRYAILGSFIKKDVTITLVDSSTKKPVTEANVTIDNQRQTSGNEGKVTFKGIGVGPHKVTVQKKYYKDAANDLNVWIMSAAQPSQIELQAMGRQVPVKVLNKLDKHPVANALVSVADSRATTDASGDATIVLPADQTRLDGSVSLEGYSTQPITVTVAEQQLGENIFSITPNGKIYFLSKRSGKIDVMKTNLDGSQQEVVLGGTGTEQEGSTQLVATRDWHYMALKSRRDGTKDAKLYIINSTNDGLTEVDSQDANYQIIGWYNEYFVYVVNNEMLKSYNANTGTSKTLDQAMRLGDSNSRNYASESYSSIQILQDDVVYSKNWSYSCKVYTNHCVEYTEHINGKSNTIVSVKPDGSGTNVLKSVAITPGEYPNISGKANKTKEVWFRQQVPNTGKSEYFIYADGSLTPTTEVNDALFAQPKATYLLSPSGSYSFWYESRDGKNTLLVGDANGDNGQTVATLTEYMPLGWYTDEYMLASKDGSELYIMPRQNTESNISKVTDFHKPQYDWPGQGYSYGWFYRFGGCCGMY